MNKWAKMERWEKEEGREIISDIEKVSFIGQNEIQENIIYMDWTLPDNFDLEDYQNNGRIYLDEYEGQEELRKDWFENNKYFLYKNRFGQNSIIFGVDISQFQEACEKLAKLGQEVYNKITKDTYFENRWIRRN